MQQSARKLLPDRISARRAARWLSLVFLGAALCMAQQAGQQGMGGMGGLDGIQGGRNQPGFGGPNGQMRPNAPNPLGDQSGIDSYILWKQMRALNAERQKELVSDTDKLLKLARELHAEIAAGGSDSLTPAQLQKIASIEKLARDVKQKMKLSVQAPGPPLRDPLDPSR